jgi:glutamyl-tRNA reductase
MRLQVVGCSHHIAPIDFRERLAFSAEQARTALERLQSEVPNVDGVLLSTCNRVELYVGSEAGEGPSGEEIIAFLARFHGLDPRELREHLYHYVDAEAVRHLFEVSSSLDSMVVGEPQILAQVKQAYQSATDGRAASPLIHCAFQAALKTARRIATETSLQQRRVSIPSVAVADFAQRIFERFDDKKTLVIGAGEMAEETLRYLRDEGIREVTVVNRSYDRALALAQRWQGRALPWEQLFEALAVADLVISTSGAAEPIVRMEQFLPVEARREQRTLFILDLAVPRDFEATIGARPGVFLYSIDDLRAVCESNRKARDQELPAARRIIQQETDRLMADLHLRATGPIIRRLQQGWEKPKEEELRRLFNKLPELDDRARDEIRQSYSRLLNKLLHPPLESLRDESRHGIPHSLLDALARLFQLKD